MSQDDLVAIARAHAAAETRADLAATLATLEDEPVYELQPVGRVLVGMDRARRYYEQFFRDFLPVVTRYELRGEWANAEGLLQEYTIWTGEERHDVIGILTFGATRLSGERLYAGERILRLMFGPLFDETQPLR
jgi:hypothetical protein